MNRISCLLTLALAPLISLAAPPSVTMPREHLALFENYCFECHDQDVAKGDVVLDDLSFEIGDIETAERWQKVLNAMNSGEMPPEKKDQPTAEEKTTFLEALSGTMVAARDLLSDSGGEITMRRLNRREYENTLRDLLGVRVDAAELPKDGGGDGFDTSGGGLFFSSDQFEQYLKIAHRALDEAIITGERPKTQTVRREAEEAAMKQATSRYENLLKSHERAEAWRASDKPPTAFGFIDEDRVKFEDGNYQQHAATYLANIEHPAAKTGALLHQSFSGSSLDVTTLPKEASPGDYILRVRAGALKDAPSHRKFMELGQPMGGQAGELSVLNCVRVEGSWKEPSIIEIPIRVSAGGLRTFALRERIANSRDAARLYYNRAKADQDGNGFDPVIWIDWVEWEGPIVETWPPAGHQQLFFKGPDAPTDAGYVKEILARFANRAFRHRDVRPEFVERLMALYREQRNAGRSPRNAIKEPLAVILSSPSFLYLSEPVAKEVVERKRTTSGRVILTAPEFAARLSYFLWSAPPDATLKELAESGELVKPAVLTTQVNRLLADPKASEFYSGFLHQWLHMERLDFFQFNIANYPTFDDSVKHAARSEVYESFKFLVDESRPLGEWLDADYVVINDLLADYYGVPGVSGGFFRKVLLPKDSERGGLLSMAAILAMGSDGERSSPVERGAWVMRKLLNRPPPPAPANVPQLSRHEGKLLPARALLDAHMEEPQCAQCHRKIDPIGFGMENFNAAGLWREEEILQVLKNRRVTKQKAFPIEPNGTLPDGTAFEDFFGLKKAVASHELDFARGFSEALIEYGLGRPFGFSDEALLEKVVKQAQEENLAVPAFIHALVQSRAFRLK